MHWRVALILLVVAGSANAERLIVLHSVEHHEVIINVDQVTSLRPKLANDDPNKLFTKEVSCMVSLTDGKFATVVESCDAVRALIEPERKEEPK